MTSEEYVLFNKLTVLGLFVLVLSGATLYGQGELSCIQLSTNGVACASCGITRDFISFIKFDFSNPINENSIFLFVFFVAQFILRLAMGFGNLGIGLPYKIKKVITADTVITLLCLVFFFFSFWS